MRPVDILFLFDSASDVRFRSKKENGLVVETPRTMETGPSSSSFACTVKLTGYTYNYKHTMACNYSTRGRLLVRRSIDKRNNTFASIFTPADIRE